MKKQILLFLMLGISITNIAQDTIKNPIKNIFKIDSLIDAGQFMSANEKIENQTNLYKNYSSLYNSLKLKQADCLSRLGKIEESETLIKDCSLGKLTPSTAINLKNIYGYILLKKGKTEEAINQFKIALNTCKTNQKLEMAESLNNLGLAFWNNGNNELAQDNLLQSLHIYMDILGNNHAKIASSYNNLGLVLSNSQPEKALEYYKKSLELNQKLFPQNHPSIANSFTNIGILHKTKNEHNLALDNFESSMRINTEIFGSNHPTIAFLKTNIAQVFIEKKSNEKAIQNLKEANEIYSKTYGAKHPEIAQIYNLLGNIELKNGAFKNALLYYQKALISNSFLFENIDLKTNPNSNDAYNKLLLINTLTQKAKAIEGYYFNKTLKKKDLILASELYDKCDSIITNLRQTLVNKSDKIQLGAQANDVYEFGIESNLQLAEVSLLKQKYYEKAFYFNEKSKASVLLESISDANAKQFAGIPDSLIEKEKNLQSEISFINQQIAQKQDILTSKKLINQLYNSKKSFDNLTQKLKTDFPEYFNLKFAYSVANSKDITQILEKDMAVISYFVGENNHKIYVFWIDKNKLKVFSKPINLVIEKQITSFRNSIKFNLPANFNEISHQLYEQLFPFHLPQKIKNLVIIPDGKLGTIPFEALLIKKFEKENYLKAPFLLESKSISYAYSHTIYRDSKQKTSTSTSKSALICAPINFSKMKNNANLTALPSSESECLEISNVLKSNKFEPKTYINSNAKESILKTSELMNYKYIHLATHGIVNELHPELSQIFLNSDSLKKEDGNVYSWEIYGLKFNADLVTLSACQTGLGKISKGEGIIGLSRALLFAGAQNVLVSLWTVSDASTSKLMIDFYRNLTTEKFSLSESLQKSKLDLIKDPIYSSPYYWAPFILIGK